MPLTVRTDDGTTVDPYNGASMTVLPSVVEIVCELLQSRTVRPIAPGDFASDLVLGADGLGLDSIAIAEVLLQCEERFGIDTLALLQQQPLTLRALGAQLERATAG